MAVIELTPFRLTPDADETAFLAADAVAQADFSRLPTAVRRTLARAEDGRWLVLASVWNGSAGDLGALSAFIDETSVTTDGFESLAGLNARKGKGA